MGIDSRIRRLAEPASAWLAASLALVSCAGFERQADWYPTEPAPPAGWEGAGPMDPMDAAAIWGVGDSVAYAVDVTAPDLRRHYTFTLTIVGLPPPRSVDRCMADPVHGRVLTATARQNFQWGPVLALHHWGEAAIRARLVGDDGTDCERTFQHEATAHFHQESMDVGCLVDTRELFRSLLGLDCMLEELLTVVRPPSAWSVLTRFGRIQVALDWPRAPHAAIVEEDTPLGRVPTLWLPVTLDANGQPALDGRVQFTWKRSPLMLSAGVLRIEAWRPDDPTRRVTVRLIGAVRGTPADVVPPDALGHGLRVGMTLAEANAVVQGKGQETLQRGRLADGSVVELVHVDAPWIWLFVVVADGRLLFASAGDHACLVFLQQRGFVADDG